MNLLTKASYSDAVTERESRNLEIAYNAACEAPVLLKNDGILPLKGKLVALFGPGAAHTIKGGSGSGEVNERHSVSIQEGLEQRGVQITTKAWLNGYEKIFQKSRKGLKLGKSIAETVNNMMAAGQLPEGGAITAADIKKSATENCVYVISRQAGEGGDRHAEKGDFYLTDRELEDIKLCSYNYKYFVLVINCGSAIDMSFLRQVPDIKAVLYVNQLGTRGGNAIADILFGDVTPSGKLADTWAQSYSDIPFGDEFSYLNGNLQDEYYKEGIYVGYRYFDSFGREPMYPFGFGLSYTDFDISCAGASVSGGEVSLKARVKNRGRKFSGKEVVQLYVSLPQGRIDHEYQVLAAFAKTPLLAPGATAELELSFNLADVAAYYDTESAYILEKGDYILRLGSSSRNTKVAAVARLDEEAVISRHMHVCPKVSGFDVLRAENQPAGETGRAPVLQVSASAFTTVNYTYTTPPVCSEPRVKAFLDTLSTEDMADIVVGAGFGGAGRFNLPGSVGNTTSKLWDRGLANVTLCDGPAGIRIQRRSTVSAKGKVKPVDMPMSNTDALPGFIKKMMTGDPEKEPVLYQYTTAFPVASALAQTWNEPLMQQIGTAVFEEMKEYGVVYWLAPAVNIHRNPLCGRNFEYFSEDPFLAGTMAAAIIRGVQSEQGCCATIKHFACNNQEDNRNKVNSNVSERALRQIYLKPFEIAVRRAGVRSVMTSYNRLNGVYTANSYDLCTNVLRCEWGFDGVVMTDWYSTMLSPELSAGCMHAGNDLIMPGEPLSKPRILKALKTSQITEEELRRCCGNVVKAIFESPIQREYIDKK